MSQERLKQFRHMVLLDPLLQAQFRQLLDKPAFITRMLELGSEHGYEFTAEEIEAALVEARRAWNQRWNRQ